ncbi:class I SAM-dependent methyltransferase [Devosia sp. SL43]|uniref:class I SAM-dependent methyltransferase n=1 Tax=Devosia sp. SL43 TaxID=2806348 RepID=UPI001F4338E9|nr:class I SAM-dependent methyltransferase [Devosia sp. SL43]UJW84371.1 class I SAM-dependent methyltransferase [Devosia sp. SL43]
MADDLYDQPELYDLVLPDDPDMEQFYVAAAGGAGRQVLDLACGTGRFTLPLARSGAVVTGGDLSETMLASARQRANAAGLTITFAALDMRDFDLGRRFDAVTIAANSLLHLTETSDILRFLAAVKRHLKPDGQLIFDIFVPSAWLLSRPHGERQHMGEFSHPELGVITIEETIAYDPVRQVSRADWYWSRPGHPDFRHTPLTMRQIYPQELPLLLERGGFRLVERFGGFDRSAFDATSMRQVCVCALV